VPGYFLIYLTLSRIWRRC